MRTQTILLAFSILILSSCEKKEITSSGSTNNMIGQINSFPHEPISSDEAYSLVHMREEEKLALDVYSTLFSKWGISIFSNISSSEQTHTDAVLALLNKYNLPDPVQNNALGVFEDSTLQGLYDSLVTQGNTSILNAFIVGATIEDLDIYDLNVWVSKVDNQDILYAYSNLTKGSRNHMRSFYSQIINSGGIYTAQFISQAELEAIINSPKE
jgi:hypothetical protein